MVDGQTADQEALPVLLRDRDVSRAIPALTVVRRNSPIQIAQHLPLPFEEPVPERRIQDLGEEPLDLAGTALWFPVAPDLAPGVGLAVLAGLESVISHTVWSRGRHSLSHSSRRL